MKKILFSIFVAVMAIGFVGCEYDDSELVGRVDNLEQRVLTLEQLCQQMNTNITAMQAIVNALQTQDAITSVTPITEGSKTIGYTITFAKGEPITIYHGQDGKNGADGEDGKDGYTPVIGVDKDEDDVYYWTLDGEWLTDAEGNKIPTSGKDGADGEDGEGGKAGMPELRIQGGYWYVSYDGGENWERLGRATGYDGTDGKDGVDGDAFFDNVDHKSNPDFVIFTLSANGGEFYVPKYKEFSVELGTPSANYVEVNGSANVTINYTVKGCTNPTVLVISDLEAKVSNGTITVKAPATRGDLEATETVTLMVSNGSTTVMASVDITVADAVISGGANANTDFSNAVSNGDTSIVLPAGDYTLPSAAAGKTLTISGTEDTKISVKSGLTYANGANITFEGVTIESEPEGAGYTNGFADMKYATFNNCVINGTIGLDFTCEFNECEFNIAGNYYNVWTWGAGTATFNKCTFNCDGKALLVYANVLDNGTTHQTVNITDCTFNDNGDDTVTGKAAIEITNTYTPVRTYDVFITNTKVKGFSQTVPGAGDFNAAYGSVTGSNIGTNVWGNKCQLPNTQINVVIDGVDVY